jgi:hypothetical protein
MAFVGGLRMIGLQRVANARGPSRGAVVFVHGLGGDARGTWQSDEAGGNSFWPAWLGQDLSDLDVWTLGYDASPSIWFGNAMGLPDRARDVLAMLEAERLESTPLVFVCHSLGGLVVKQVLRAAYDRPDQRIGQVLHRTQGVVFLATPNTGADAAAWADRFRILFGASAAPQDPGADAAMLRDLNGWYRDHAPEEEIATLAFFEARATNGVSIVDASSADPGIPHVQPIADDADHVSIAKPASRDTALYRQILRFVEDRLPAPSASSTRLETRRRLFMSYRRRAAADARLAHWLTRQLEAAGHEVFIDINMRVGVEWSKEIDRRLEWCEFLIVLLSEESIASEMVQQEVQQAAQRRRRDGTPWFLPVRVAYDGALGYALGSALYPYQHARWDRDEDDARVLAELLSAIGAGPSPNASPLAGTIQERADLVPIVASPTIAEQPAAAADTRVLRQPGGAVRLDDPCYIAQRQDLQVRALAKQPGVTLVLKAPRQMGKTSLLVRYLHDCKQAGKKVALIDCQQLSDDDLNDQKAAMTRLGARLIKELGIDPSARQVIDSPGDLTDFLEDVIFPRFEQPIVVAFDEIDRFVSRPYRDSLFAAMRGWHNNRGLRSEKWESLDLALVIATEPSMLIQDGEQSPFNVAEPFRLEPFGRLQLDRLNHVFGRLIAAGDLDVLHELTGGQPYLARLAFWRLSTGGMASFRELDRHAADDDGPFGEHLRTKLSQLQRRPELLEVFGSLIRRGVQPSQDDYWRLHAAGLANRRQDGTVVPANLLYARFFQRILR